VPSTGATVIARPSLVDVVVSDSPVEPEVESEPALPVVCEDPDDGEVLLPLVVELEESPL
jgi:hypothetical protein